MGDHLRDALVAVRKLTRDEQVELIDEILIGLPPEDPDALQEWIAECQRRMDSFDRGESEAIDADVVFDELLKRR